MPWCKGKIESFVVQIVEWKQKFNFDFFLLFLSPFHLKLSEGIQRKRAEAALHAGQSSETGQLEGAGGHAQVSKDGQDTSQQAMQISSPKGENHQKLFLWRTEMTSAQKKICC